MPFIGTQPQVGAYSKLDAITTSATATYNLTLNSGAYYPSSANHLMVSLNGVMQAPQDSFTISGATIIFASTLASTDSIDFIMALGDVLDIGTPSDGTVVTAKMQDAAVTTAKLASTLDLSGKTVTYGLTDSDMPAGAVLQVVSTHVTDTFATTSTNYVDITGMTVSITPSSTSSKILVQVIGQAGNLTGGYMTMVQLNRNGTAIAGGVAVSNRPSAFAMSRPSNVDTAETVGGVYLDSPSSTSAVVYKLQMKVQGATGTFNRTGRDVDAGYTPRTAASIIVQEIAG